MEKKNFKRWLFYFGIVLIFVGIFLNLLFTGLNNEAVHVVSSSEKDLFEIIFNCITSEVSIVLLIGEIIFLILGRSTYKKEQIRKIVQSVGVWIMVCFYQVAILYPLNQYFVAIVGLGFCIICLMYALSPTKYTEIESIGYVKDVLKKLNNDKIVSVQTYNVEKKEVGQDVIYNLTYDDSLSKSTTNINGILSIEYTISKEELTTIESVVSTYLQLVDTGNDRTEESLVAVLESSIVRMKNILAKIEKAEDVTERDCCTARILLIYLSFLKILRNPSGNTDGESVSEFGIGDGEVCSNLDVERKLFTMIRSGLLAAAVLGENLRYIFMYKKDGYKNGRKYCVSKIRNSHKGDNFMICLIALKEDKYRGIRSDVMRAIGQIERKMETLFTDVRGVNHV